MFINSAKIVSFRSFIRLLYNLCCYPIFDSLFFMFRKKYFKNRFLFKGEIERIESLLVDWGLNCENREPKGQIRKSHEAKFEIEFFMGFNCTKPSLNPFWCDWWIFRGSNHFLHFWILQHVCKIQRVLANIPKILKYFFGLLFTVDIWINKS